MRVICFNWPRDVLLLLVLAALAIDTRAGAVSTSHWEQTSEADFKAGTFKQTVATSLGEVKLARAVKSIMGDDPRISAVYALAEMPDGTIYAGTGPAGVLLKISGKTVTTVTKLGDGTNIFSLLVDQDNHLLIGTGGAKGRVLRLEADGQTKEIFAAEGVQYVWAMAQTPDGKLYLATGPNGQLFEVSTAGASRVLFKSDQNNFLCLLSDGKDSLWAGTDPTGLLYRINRQTGQAFVVYDAAESEISALAMDDQGNLYAATADSPEPSRLNVSGAEAGATERTGHPEEEKPQVPIPSQPPTSPKPPQIPPGGPGEPNQLPRSPAGPTTRADAGAAIPARDVARYFLTDGSPSSSRANPQRQVPDQPPDQPAPPDQPPDQAPGNGGDNGGDNGSADTGQTADQAAHGLHGPAIANQANAPNPAGTNAIYKIDRDGFVTEVFRQNEMVFALAEQSGVLLAGTGSDGEVFQINPGAQETSVLTKVDAKVVTALLPTRDGRVLLGTANTGGLSSMSAGYATTGTYTSAAMDAKQISRWGKLRLHGSLPAHTSITVATRSGNIESSTDPGWSDWSAEAPAAEYLPITAPIARFLQYRLTMGSTDGAASPVISEVRSGYQVPNLPPEIKSVKVAASTASAASGSAQANAAQSGAHTGDSDAAHPSAVRTITWDASDPNGDALRYTVYFRMAGGPWTLLKDKLTDVSYDWNTRNAADGRYEVKVVASDAAANPPGEGRSASRVSERFTIDNTPPEIGDLQADTLPGQARIRTRVVDRTSSVALLEYSLDSAEDWQTVLPVDIIADSPQESYDFLVSGLTVGRHQITLRATDDPGNQSYQTLQVTVEKAAP